MIKRLAAGFGGMKPTKAPEPTPANTPTHTSAQSPKPEAHSQTAAPKPQEKQVLVTAEFVGLDALQAAWEVSPSVSNGDTVEVFTAGDQGRRIDYQSTSEQLKGSHTFDLSRKVNEGENLEVRYVDGQDSKTLGTSKPVVAPTRVPPESLQTSLSVAFINKDALQVNWEVPWIGVSENDSVGLYNGGSDDVLASTYATGQKKDSVKLDVMGYMRNRAPLEVRYVHSESSAVLATSASFFSPLVGKPGSIEISWNEEQLQTKWTTYFGELSTSDYLALYEVGAEDNNYLTYEYATGANEGTTTINVLSSMDTDKTYCIRYIWAEDSHSVAESEPFTKPQLAEVPKVDETPQSPEPTEVTTSSGEPSVPSSWDPQPDDSLTANFDASTQEIVVTWDFSNKKFSLSPYDYLYVHAATDIKAEIMSAYESVSSGEVKGSKNIALKGQLKSDWYFVRYTPMGNSDETIMYSRPFLIQGIVAREDCDFCQVLIQRSTSDDGFPELWIDWELRKRVPGVSSSDSFVLLPESFILSAPRYSELAYHQDKLWCPASGKPSGKIDLRVLGYVQPDVPYVVLYVQAGTPEVVLGRSSAFSFSKEQLPETSDKEAVRSKTMLYNQVASVRFSANEARQKLTSDFNPLLTITPEKSKFEKLLVEADNRKSKRKQDAELQAQKQVQQIQESDASVASAAVHNPADDVLDEAKLFSLVSSEFETQGFIYAGAGVSMSAPSSSPSWWALMNETLQATFRGAPPEHAEMANKLGKGDISRQPEEIMESYYFAFQDRLFTLFQLLEAGRPNGNHIAMAKLAKAGKVKAILTTNFDIFIERALQEEGVSFRVIVTNDEFREFYETGCSEFAVLKIHGTVDRPDTIVAVANHYKMGKGFGGFKGTVLAHYLRHYPTLFVGYSGWDFEHANYQAFWAQAGEEGGKNVYWLTLKGMRGGPDLRKILGTHIGSRLQIGASLLPEFLAMLVGKYNSEEGESIIQFQKDIDVDKENQLIATKRQEFLVNWVGGLPKAPLLTLLWMEASRLNVTTQERLRRQKEHRKVDGDTESATPDTAAMTAFYTKLAGDMAAGLMTMDEYMETIQLTTLDMTFAHVVLPKTKKDELKRLFLRLSKSEPLFTTDPDAQTFKATVPSFLMSVAEGAPDTSTSQELMDSAMDHMRFIATFPKTDRRSLVLRETYLYQAMFLRCSADDKEYLRKLFSDFADRAVQENYDDDRVREGRTKEVQPTVLRLAYGMIDSSSIVQSQLRLILEAHSQNRIDEFLEGSMLLALGLQRQSMYRISDFMTYSSYSKRIASILGINANAEIDEVVFREVEQEFTGELGQLLDLLKDGANKNISFGSLTAQEVLAAFEIAASYLWLDSTKYLGNRYTEQQQRERHGFYPHDALPPSVVKFLTPRVKAATTVIRDDRISQASLALLAILGDSTGDISVMEHATLESLKLTQGKVVELTPYPIPEALAVAYQEQGDLVNSLHYFEKALDGIKTCVIRQKTDAIVLQACLVQSTFSIEAALRWAFTFSPHFSTVQQIAGVGPGREILVQQALKWAQDLGYNSLTEAEDALMKKE
eukprot:c10192_g1_i1.p1 GENE.c10192_g1_i1~~c10192_g1_i1.p1  ORF type:complete len:1577 (+),score=392.16 c10192_g1_i1:42-4733(+)